MLFDPTNHHRSSPLRARLQTAESYADYKKLCLEIDKAEGTLAWRKEEKDMPQVCASCVFKSPQTYNTPMLFQQCRPHTRLHPPLCHHYLQAVLLKRTIEELDEALREGNLPQLRFLLGGVFRVRMHSLWPMAWHSL